mmetsp:Transcript_39526/g.40286  ORF Transcript_39526/g.40286 Transcript_39526/m.40286 type:complete len:102 (+) Transcript_39526:35-340(+)
MIRDGIIRIAVPDIVSLCSLMVDLSLSSSKRYEVMQMIYGGQLNQYDYHQSGYTYSMLQDLLEENGFCDVKRRSYFGIFTDSSDLIFMGRNVSLNVEARAC